MGSTRLPGKVLAEVAGRPLLSWLLERLGRAQSLDELIVATTDLAEDDPIAELWPCFRGSSSDVLDRYLRAAEAHEAKVVVRMTGDCPLLDPELVDQVVDFFIEHYPRYDYVSTGMDRAFPRGMDVEVMKVEALRCAAMAASDPYDREHVTPYIYRHPEKFSLCEFGYRLTVDTAEDLEAVRPLMERFGIDATYPQLVEALYADHR